MPVRRTRLAVALVSLAALALELALMRALSLRFWHHFAHMVISVALLGFGASGTLLTIFRRWIAPHRRGWLALFAAAFAAAIPISLHAFAWATPVSLHDPAGASRDLQSLAWDLSRLTQVAEIELLLLVPFFFGAAVIGVALMDAPHRLAGHYAANLIGSGLGAVLAVAAMHFVDTSGLITAVMVTACVAAAVVLPWAHVGAAAAAVILFAGRKGRRLLAAGAAAVVLWAPYRPALSPYKTLPQMLDLPGSKVIDRADGPLGRIDVVAGPAIHYAPGLSLRYGDQPPDHVLLIIDGDQTAVVYDCEKREEWQFLDYTTAASAYHLRQRPRALVLGAGGGSAIGLAVYHRSPNVVAIEMNGQVIDLMTGPLADRGGSIYEAKGVRVEHAEMRGYLARTHERFDVIQLAAADAGGAGLHAAQESYLYTVESIGAMLDRLRPGGLACLTVGSHQPREGLRLFETAAEVLRRRGSDPRRHLALIRNGIFAATLLVSNQPLSDEDADKLRTFCRQRWFDVCYLPGIRADEVNRYHVLDRPSYYEGALALLGPDREKFLDDYLFRLRAATDDKPFFFHFFRWKSLPALREQLGQRSRAYLDLGYLMLLATIAQAVVLALVMILLPLVPGVGALRRTRGRGVALAYFLLLGLAFMLLEMGFLQKLILYLAHPIYSAAVVIASFLLFAGLGSEMSGRWPGGPRRVIGRAAAAVVVLAGAYLLGLDYLLSDTQGQAMWVRFAISAGVIAPLAFAMGHLFPAGLGRLAGRSPRLVPWAWAVNGFASVAATVGAPLLAMTVGFSRLVLVAVGAYALAGVLGARLLGSRRRAGGPEGPSS